MKLIDTHCHLDFPELSADIEAVLARAQKAGVDKFVVPGVSVNNWNAVLTVCSEHAGLYPALGLHPCFLKGDHRADLVSLASMLKQHRQVVAVGEIGLDLFIPEANLQLQLEVLMPQLLLAKEYHKPVLLHVRKAHDQMLKQLRLLKLERAGLVHAFSGSEQQAREYLKLGFKLGIGGAVTYDRATRLRRLVAELPLESFVLETDSPDMPLMGYQGEINYPERVSGVAETIAQIRQQPLAEVVEVMATQSINVLAL